MLTILPDRSLKTGMNFTETGMGLKLGIGHFGGLAPVVQRADNFVHWISRYPAERIYSSQWFCKVFLTITFLNLTYASTLFTNYI